MKGDGPKRERETIIRFDSEDDNASVWTSSETVHRRLMKRLGQSCLTLDGKRHSIWEFPKKLIKLPILRKAPDPRTLAQQNVAKMLGSRRTKGQTG